LSLPLIILRPEPGASATLKRAQAMGLAASCHPLFEVHPVLWSPPDPAQFEALLITSANALRHGGPGLQSLMTLPVITVGSATGDAARRAGFTVVYIGDGDVNAALDNMPTARRILRLAGRDHIPLARADRTIETVTVYASDPISSTFFIKGLTLALVHSARAAARFSKLAKHDKSKLILVTISAAVAAQAGEGWHAIHVAKAPDDAAMLELARTLCNHTSHE
jgi:uroporphyrinogen-III synthase